jgi:predicted transcriptional regulator
VSLPAPIAKRVNAIARIKKTSANRVIVDLIESGLEAQEEEKKRFFELTDRLMRSKNAGEQRRLKEELAQLVFGD